MTSGKRSCQGTSPKPGRITITTPMKPTTTAPQRRQPTRSLSSGTESAVTRSGATKVMV